jgi:alpha-tubulin suppressor-like RCC1 family protein
MKPEMTWIRQGALSLVLLGLLSSGCSSSVTDPQQPPSGLAYPTNPAAYVLGVAVAANRPTNSGGAVDSYSVTPALPAGLHLDPVTGFITGTPEVVTATSSFTVSAANTAGSTTAILYLTVTAAAAGEVPGTPTQVLAVAGIRSAAVSWTAPTTTGGSALTGYQVLVSPATPAALISVTGTAAVVNGLANGTSYTFAILATSAAGPGPVSLPAAPVTTPDLPSPPLDVVGVAGNGLAYLTWTEPALGGGRPVETYLVLVAPAVASSEVNVVGTTGVVSGLTNGLSYSFQVVAVNAVGEGPPSAPSLAVTPNLSACAADAACVGNGWCLAGSCQPPFGLTLASSIAAAGDGKTYVSGDIPLAVAVTGGDPVIQLALVGEGNLQVVGPPAYAFGWDTAARAEGSHLVVATAVGGTRTYSSNVLEIVVDRTRPLPPVLDSMAASTNMKPVVLAGTAEALALLTVFDAGLAVKQVEVPAGGHWTAAVALAEGSHALTATATDRAGNRSAASAPLALAVDWTAPLPPVIDPVASPLTSTALNLVGDAEADSMVEVAQDGVTLPGSVRASGGRWARALTLPATGSVRLVATATDATGNRSFGSVAVVVEVVEVAHFHVGGVISGLSGSGLTLASPGQPNLAIPAGATTFAFANMQAVKASYTVTVFQQPGTPAQVCQVTDGSGTVGSSDVTSVALSCRSAWSKVAGGFWHTVGIRPDGTLWAWGYNAFGQIGDGTTTDKAVPQQIGGGYASVAAGWNHTVAVRADGTLWAWGSNDFGQLGDGTTTQQNSPKQIGTGYASVAAGSSHTVAVKTNGTLWAWGSNADGQLGDGTTTQQNSPKQIGTGYATVAAGIVHTLAVKTDGTLWAWGRNGEGQLGDGTNKWRNAPMQVGSGYASVAAGGTHSAAVKVDGTLLEWGNRFTPGEQTPPIQVGSGYASVAAGYWQTVALKTDGTIWAWGNNAWGQLGDGTIAWRFDPVLIGSEYTSVAMGYGHSMAVRTDGTLLTWGWNIHGQLGDGTTTTQYAPKQIGIKYASVAAGYGHTVGVKVDGTLWAWGRNSEGRLGDGTMTWRSAPVQIGVGYASVATGAGHSVAVKKDGTLWAWGGNDQGQLGDWTTTNQLVPEQIGSGYALVAAGDSHTVAVRTDGTLWAWGSNDSGQLGDGTTTQQNSPKQIGIGYASVAAGTGHTVAVKMDGTLWAWGWNDQGQLGDGTMTWRYAPVLIGSGYASVAAGYRHTVAVKTDGTLWAWGYNPDGQLGDGTTTNKAVPQLIGSGYASVDAGYRHTVAVKTDGTVWAWGFNNYGQVGDGTTMLRSIPVQVGSGYAAVTAGWDHTAAVKADGALWAWGWNESGQLGDGGGSKLSPTPVP